MDKKIKILIDNNGSKSCEIGLVKPMLELYNNNQTKYEIDIESNLDPTNIEYFTNYDYIMYHRNIGNDYEKCKTLIQSLKETNTKTILYVDEFWQLPKEHPYYNKFNEKRFSDKITNNIRLVDGVYCFNNKKLFHSLQALNKNVFFIEDLPTHNSEIEKSVGNGKLKLGLIPSIYDIENIKLLGGVSKYPNKINDIQFILMGFDPRGTTNRYNRFTGELTEVVKKPEDTIWAEYERIITDNYKLCSEEYKEFLLKFLPNSKYNGDIENEPYRRIWYNEDDIEYNILVKPLLKNKYNELKFDYDILYSLNRGMGVVSTFEGTTTIKKPTELKQWVNAFKEKNKPMKKSLDFEKILTEIEKIFS